MAVVLVEPDAAVNVIVPDVEFEAETFGAGAIMLTCSIVSSVAFSPSTEVRIFVPSPTAVTETLYVVFGVRAEIVFPLVNEVIVLISVDPLAAYSFAVYEMASAIAAKVIVAVVVEIPAT